MNVLFENVTLAFTGCMLKPSDYGGWNYSFIIDKDKFCKTVRDTLASQKKPVWDAKKNTNEFILEKCNAKTRDNVKHEKVQSMMGDNDILVQVKSKSAPIENTKNVILGRGTTADILIDIFEYSYGKRDFICIRAHADRYCTVKILNLVPYIGSVKGFEKESEALGEINNLILEDVTSI